MWCVWTAKGGSGASVVSAALAVLAAKTRPTLLVDLGRDQLALLGIAEPEEHVGAGGHGDRGDGEDSGRLGVLDWVDAPCPPPDALARLEIEAGPGLSVLPTGDLVGRGHPDGPGAADDGRRAERLDILSRLLRSEQRAVIVDVGAAGHRYEAILARAHASILVTRACYLALRRPVPARHLDRVVLVAEPGRALRRADVESALHAAVAASIPWDPSVARAVDAGTLARRLPRQLRSLGPLLDGLPVDSGGNAIAGPAEPASPAGTALR